MDETILINYLREQCDEKECKQVERWTEESPENRRTLEQLYCTLFIGDRIAAMNVADTEASLRKFKSAIREREEESKKERKVLSLRWRRGLSVAAAFLTGLVIAGGISWGLLSGKLSDYVVATTGGQRAQTVLPDGSKVWLNGATRLTYHHSFWNSKRQVSLSGEAYFEVNHNKRAPFIVHSGRIKTCVLGTKFNVRAREEENRVVTTLLQGSVRIDSPKTEGKGILLKPGQTLDMNATTYNSKLIEYGKPAEVLLWIKGRLTFNRSSLQAITSTMEKVYDVQFVYEDEQLKSEQFTGEFSTDSTPDEILNVLMHTNHFSYRQEGRMIYLFKK
ncbi:FecR family protein [Bacteroides pyogenes]|uniref:FecR family protein n=1 Tax=Bacteroides pyogenes TaxID=310300 RepID=UPI001F36B3F6|nr:FecR domain-containing protein [Bacteroides pyogenes]MCF2708983.1 FecR domain-containing protein [Bacteroides pyogenes]